MPPAKPFVLRQYLIALLLALVTLLVPLSHSTQAQSIPPQPTSEPTATDANRVPLWRDAHSTPGIWQIHDANVTVIPSLGSFFPGMSSKHVNIGSLTPGDHYLYFIANEFIVNENRYIPHLYRTDGTEAGTILLTNVISDTSGVGPTQLTTIGDTLYFLTSDPLAPQHTALGLWRSDGTAAGTTQLIANIANPHASLTVVNHRLLMRDTPKVKRSWGLWRLNDDQDSFERLIDFSLRENDDELFSAQGFVSISGHTFFQNPSDASGAGLWTSDGTISGTVRLDGFSAQELIAGEHLIYGKYVDGDRAIHYWRSDGTRAGSFEIKTFTSPSPIYPYPSTVEIIVRDRLFIVYAEANKPLELWSSNGTPDNTLLLANLLNTGAYYPPIRLATDQHYLYIKEYFRSAIDSPYNIALWRSDGNPSHTRRILTVSGSIVGLPAALMANNGQIFFNFETAEGSYLLRTNGYSMCSQITAFLNLYGYTFPAINPYSVDIPLSVRVKNILYFPNQDLEYGSQLWAVDTSILLACNALYLPSVASP